ncbi:MAG: hydantoinase B/oxoprolinase family protein [Thermoplasmatota archaeon]
MSGPEQGWEFWIDRGGTFTDIVALDPEKELHFHKLLSEDPSRYHDAVVHGVREVISKNSAGDPKESVISSMRMGTTVGTNALLERKGERCALIVNRGFRDLLRIGYQDRPDIFAMRIDLPSLLYEEVVEIGGRMDTRGGTLEDIDRSKLKEELSRLRRSGIGSLAVVLMNSYVNDEHEREVGRIADEIGFHHVSLSSEVSRLIKIVGRGDTTVVDAYLSPLLLRYIRQVQDDMPDPSPRMLFMQSHGGLIEGGLFRGKDCILSGPAGGVIGGVEVAKRAGYKDIITFDMGGTSTDVSHYSGGYERTYGSKIAGVRIRSPMLRINTVAAGGGSIVSFRDGRLRVGPRSAGADPGPKCYRKGGPLTVTDCNVLLGRISPDHFPSVFGPDGSEPIDADSVRKGFEELADRILQETGREMTPEEVAEGALEIAVENMAQAIKTISVERGYDISDHLLCSFGGAGGQHACRIADRLGIQRILVHPLAGVLSALGMGLAPISVVKERTVECDLEDLRGPFVIDIVEGMRELVKGEMEEQGIHGPDIEYSARVHVRYHGSDTSIPVALSNPGNMMEEFSSLHTRRFGFLQEKKMIAAAISLEGVHRREMDKGPLFKDRKEYSAGSGNSLCHICGKDMEVPIYDRSLLAPGRRMSGPALVMESTGTNVIEPGWEGRIDGELNLILERRVEQKRAGTANTEVDPVMLEIFNRLFMSIAEQMGYSLANTAHSVNIKERLDFSCALFDPSGELVANAPHIPVHLGSMSESVLSWLENEEQNVSPGDVFLVNSPYAGGTHLPDITVITPVYSPESGELLFFTASRGHHADIGGTTPGSMPPESRHIDEEGALASGFKVVEKGIFREEKVLQWLTACRYPARNPSQNMADLKAQIAANEKGSRELLSMVERYGAGTVKAYMCHVRDNAEASVRRVIDVLKEGGASVVMDNGSRIQVRITMDKDERSAVVDFSGTSSQLTTNFNAPRAVVKAAVLYVFRTLVPDPIPLNGGCMRPITIRIPKGSMLDPVYPAPVVAGNVETSQHIVDALFYALGKMAGSQGTMNNLTFGNEEYQYYETICGGTGAGPGFHGTDGVHSHMTNTRITDPEVLESRYPVRLKEFSIRKASGGIGRYHGGDGVRRVLTFLEEMEVSILSSHRRTSPAGLEGAGCGSMGRNTVIRKDGQREDLGGCGSCRLGIGDSVEIRTPGGGGFGRSPDP